MFIKDLNYIILIMKKHFKFDYSCYYMHSLMYIYFHTKYIIYIMRFQSKYIFVGPGIS